MKIVLVRSPSFLSPLLRKFFGIIFDWITGNPSWKIFLRAPYYKYFDTYDAPKRPVRFVYPINNGGNIDESE